MSLMDRIEAAVAVRGPHAQLDDDDLWTASLDQREHVRSRVCRADDLDVLHRLQRPPEPLEHQPVVVRDQNLHFEMPPCLVMPGDTTAGSRGLPLPTVEARGGIERYLHDQRSSGQLSADCGHGAIG